MFIGEYQHNLDSKNRIIIPSKFREELEDTFILTRGIDNCLAIYPKNHFSSLVNEMRKLPDYSSNHRRYKKMMLSSAFEVSIDSMGRIQIPINLKSFFPDKSCTLLGVDDHVEIWHTESWKKYYEEMSDNMEAITEDIGVKLI